jgi:hypothetical protein
LRRKLERLTYANGRLDNYVVADQRCSGFTSSSLAAADHLSRWTRRFVGGSSDHDALGDLAHRAMWQRDPDRSLNVARAIYLRLPDDARLWLRGKEFVSPNALAIDAALEVVKPT